MKIKNKILYVSCACSKKTENFLFNNNAESIGLQIQKYHRLLMNGFKENNINVYGLSYHPGIEKLGITEEIEENIIYDYIITSIKRLNHFQIIIKSFFKAHKYLKKNQEAVVLCDVLSFSNCFGAILAAKFHKRKVIGIITDFPEQLSSGNRIYSFCIWKIISMCSYYVVMTKYMAERLNPEKPFLVLEGHVDINSINKVTTSHLIDNRKICVYAGTLHEKYGIKKLVEAFILANVDGAELHIFGNGDCREWIKHLTNQNVIYHGIVDNEAVTEFERKACVLINPRPTNEEFTKYSFPSKNMEYMVSGTPVITTALPGMPIEYNKYVYLFKDESVSGMANTLQEILLKDPVELCEMGERAKQFVLKEKNNIIQAKKIIDKFSCYD